MNVGSRKLVERVLYRLVRSDPPSVDDFLSNAAKGLQPLDDAHFRYHDGVSFQATEIQIRNKSRIIRGCRYYAVARFLRIAAFAANDPLGEVITPFGPHRKYCSIS